MQLAVLADIAGLATPPILQYDPVGTLAPEERRRVVERTLGELKLAGTVQTEGAQDLIAAPIAALLRLLYAPYVVIYADVARDGVSAERQWACGPNGAVEVTELEDRDWQFSAIPLAEVLPRVCLHAGLVERPQPASNSATASSGTLFDLRELLADPSALTRALSRDGTDSATAPLITAALSTAIASAHVAIVSRPSSGTISGGELTWIDGDDAGLWTVPSPDELSAALEDPAATFDLRPVSKAEIENELRSYLPA